MRMDPKRKEVLDRSSLVVICVSKQYQDQCREEAAYVRELEKLGSIDVLYVMLDDNYNTDSQVCRVIVLR